MNIVRLTYASRLKKNMSREDLAGIVTVSRRNNKKLGVTGALCHSPRGFLQILEGPADAVNDLFRRIVQDPRHSNVTLIEYTKAPFREFENWSMAYVHSDELAAAILHKYSTGHLFDPFSMGPTQARVFLLAVTELRAHYLAHQEAEAHKPKTKKKKSGTRAKKPKAKPKAKPKTKAKPKARAKAVKPKAKPARKRK